MVKVMITSAFFLLFSYYLIWSSQFSEMRQTLSPNKHKQQFEPSKLIPPKIKLFYVFYIWKTKLLQLSKKPFGSRQKEKLSFFLIWE